MTNFDPYQPERQLPAESPYYPPSGPQYAVQPYVSQPYPVYAPQPYPMYPMLRTSGLAVAGMIIGILALIGFWIPVADLLLGFLAIGLSWAGIVQCGRPGYSGKGMAIAGLVCGILGVLPAIVIMLFFFGAFAALGTCGIAC
ncbi:DUF4190 domain-containing protein [Amycolatopsis sp. OK19-0408]|uniref:DUF4190 domain-containing protein n=1 Tax=Amycolatopsis iheyensis TaxID=2945988 RepID=A0A9X2NBJ3_9PSEU|nr:DUF4190 domain-containing protein [Amycolatopsis iheyensis]MCR6484176.1 DUF4190 domain-containing protein [Amycolatopsis iheyensis]